MRFCLQKGNKNIDYGVFLVTGVNPIKWNRIHCTKRKNETK